VKRRFFGTSNPSVVFSTGTVATLASKYRFRARLRGTDAFVVGHPKSGNTWLAYMLAVVKEAGDPEQRVNVANVGVFIPAAHRYEALHVVGSRRLLRSYDRLANPRVFRNEEPVYPELYPRTVYLVRDPRAVLVSYYHHYKAEFDDPDMSMDRFVSTYLRDPSAVGAPIARWDVQVGEWMRRAGAQRVLIVRYEDLHEDPEGCLSEIVAFCDIPATTEAVRAAGRRGAFEAMQQEERRYGAESAGFRLSQRRGQFYRRGAVDGWREELPSAAHEAIDATFGSLMETLGYLGPSRTGSPSWNGIPKR
jgi:hypothetical protein